MALVKLSDYERELIIEVVSKRLNTIKKDFNIRSIEKEKPSDRYLKMTYEILSIINSNFINLTSTHKAYISGCLMEHILDKSKDIRTSTEFDFLLQHDRSNWENRYLKYDITASLRNRFSVNQSMEKKHRLIRPIQEKIEAVMDCNKILYTMSDKIYKIALYNSTLKKYWILKTDNDAYFDTIIFDSYQSSSFINYSGSGTPFEILELIKVYENHNEPILKQIKLKQLVRKMIECNNQVYSEA